MQLTDIGYQFVLGDAVTHFHRKTTNLFFKACLECLAMVGLVLLAVCTTLIIGL